MPEKNDSGKTIDDWLGEAITKQHSNIASAAKTVGSVVKQAAKDSLLRTSWSVVENQALVLPELVEKVTGGKYKAPERPASVKLPGAVGDFIGPVTSYQRAIQDRVAAGENKALATAKEGGMFLIDEPVGVAYKGIGLVGGAILKNAAKTSAAKKLLSETTKFIAASDDAAEIATKLSSVMQRVPKEKIDEAATALANITDEKQVLSAIDSLGGSMYAFTKKEAEKQFDDLYIKLDKALYAVGDEQAKPALAIAGKVEDIIETAKSADLSPSDYGKVVAQAEDIIEELKAVSYSSDDLIEYGIRRAEELVRGGDVPVLSVDELDNVVVKGPVVSEADKTARLNRIWDNLMAADPTGDTPRGFAETMRRAPRTSTELAERVDFAYDHLPNQSSFEQAAFLLAQGEKQAIAKVLSPETPFNSRTAALTMMLISNAEKAKDFDLAYQLSSDLATKATTAGQANQILAIWGRTSPAGIIRFAQKELSKHGVKPPVELLKELADDAIRIKSIPEGWKKQFEIAKMYKKISDRAPRSVSQKLATTQILSLLLAPKTFVRNIGGNAGFNALENVSDVFAAMIDSPLSLLTGKRAKVLPSMTAQVRAGKRGFTEGLEEALAGVNTRGIATSNDLPLTTTFADGTIGGKLETLLRLELNVPDRMFYEAAYDGSLWNQLKAYNMSLRPGEKALLEPTEYMKEVARADAAYRTFQNNTWLASSLTSVKKGLNKLTSDKGEFGFGSALLPFPRTPSNILMAGLDYSATGYIRAIGQLKNAVYTRAGVSGAKPFNQKTFVEAISRASLGSAGLAAGIGYQLSKVGILNAKGPDDKPDVLAAKRHLGMGDYMINVSALKRYLLTFDEELSQPKDGDTLMSYDWLQPMSIPIVIGANLQKNDGELKGDAAVAVLSAVVNGLDTIAEQPMLSSMNKFVDNLAFGGMSDAIAGTLKDLPAMYVPSLLKNLRELYDNGSRDTYSREMLDGAIMSVLDRTPAASQELPRRVSVYGVRQQRYENNTNNWFNVLFNPVFVKHYKDDPGVEMLLDIYKSTDDTGVLPNTKKREQTVNGVKVQLTNEMYNRFQYLAGWQIRRQMNILAAGQDVEFNSLETPEEKAKYIKSMLDDISMFARYEVLKERTARPTKRTKEMLMEYWSAGGSMQK